MRRSTLTLTIDESFQTPVSELLIRLHRFLRGYIHKPMGVDFDWHPKADDAYDEFLGILDDAIKQLEDI